MLLNAFLLELGLIVERDKEGMLLYAATPQKTPPSKAVRKYIVT